MIQSVIKNIFSKRLWLVGLVFFSLQDHSEAALPLGAAPCLAGPPGVLACSLAGVSLIAWYNFRNYSETPGLFKKENHGPGDGFGDGSNILDQLGINWKSTDIPVDEDIEKNKGFQLIFIGSQPSVGLSYYSGNQAFDTLEECQDREKKIRKSIDESPPRPEHWDKEFIWPFGTISYYDFLKLMVPASGLNRFKKVEHFKIESVEPTEDSPSGSELMLIEDHESQFFQIFQVERNDPVAIRHFRHGMGVINDFQIQVFEMECSDD